MQITQDRIIWDSSDWLRGLLPGYQSTSGSSITQRGTGLSHALNFNPLRSVYLGYASPGASATDVTNVSIVATVIRNIVVNNSLSYMVGGSLIHRGDPNSSNALVNDTAGTGYPRTIVAHGGHTTPVASDIVLYTAKIGGVSALRVFYSWNDNTDWDVGVVTSLTAAPNTFDDDFMSTAPVPVLNTTTYAAGKDYPHPMMVGDDDILYIGDRNFLHAYDGQGADNDGAFYAAALTLPNGYIITSFAKIEGFLVIFAYQSNAGGSFYLGESKAFFYDYYSFTATKIVDLQDNYVSGGFIYDQTVGCFTAGRVSPFDSTRSTKLKIFNGSQFETKAKILANPPIHGGVDVTEGIITWNSDGLLFSYGSGFEGFPAQLQQIASGGGTTLGVCRSIAAQLLVASTGTTTSGGMQRFNNAYATGSVQTGLVEMPMKDGMVCRPTMIRVRFADVASGGRNIVLTISDRAGNSNTVISSAQSVTAITTSTLVRQYKIDATTSANFKNYDSFLATLTWQTGSGATSAPIISTIELFYEYVLLRP